MQWTVIPLLVGTLILVLSGSILYLRQRLNASRLSQRKIVLNSLSISDTDLERKRFIGFFHPYCNAGGGGERVLWTAIAFLQRTESDVINVVYSGDQGVTKAEIIDKVKARFDIELDPGSLHFVFLRSRKLVEEAMWPRFTLLGQSLGSIYLAWEAVSHFVPDLYIDTMGYSFTFYIVRLLGNVPVGAYVHYPTISTEMLRRVRTRMAWHTNQGSIPSSAILSYGKQLYYRIFMYFYSKSLHHASFLMVNSTWTKNHVDAVINYKFNDTPLSVIHAIFGVLPLGFRTFINIDMPPLRPTRIVYPPCDTKPMSAFTLDGRDRTILSLAQFRPEKDHAAQLHAFGGLLKSHPEYRSGEKRVALILMGSSRNADDAARVQRLENLAVELDIRANVEFVVNAPYSVLLNNLSRASIGISTMVDEHFGINVVEFMAAGLIPVVHASGGPLNDIVVPQDGKPTGYHCTTPASFSDSLHAALTLSPEEDLAMRRRARRHAVKRFSVDEFEKAWKAGGWIRWKEEDRL